MNSAEVKSGFYYKPVRGWEKMGPSDSSGNWVKVIRKMLKNNGDGNLLVLGNDRSHGWVVVAGNTMDRFLGSASFPVEGLGKEVGPMENLNDYVKETTALSIDKMIQEVLQGKNSKDVIESKRSNEVSEGFYDAEDSTEYLQKQLASGVKQLERLHSQYSEADMVVYRLKQQIRDMESSIAEIEEELAKRSK